MKICLFAVGGVVWDGVFTDLAAGSPGSYRPQGSRTARLVDPADGLVVNSRPRGRAVSMHGAARRSIQFGTGADSLRHAGRGHRVGFAYAQWRRDDFR